MTTKPELKKLGGIFLSPTVGEWSTDMEVIPLIRACVEKFTAGDWGAVDESIKEQNVQVIEESKHGSKLIGFYEVPGKGDVWIVTDNYGLDRVDGDVASTTVLTPEEY